MLSVIRRKDRDQMANSIKDVAETYGAQVYIDSLAERDVLVAIELGDVRASILLEGDTSLPDVFVVAWTILPQSNARFSKSFGKYVNTVHRKKSTEYVSGFSETLGSISSKLQLILTGSAVEY